MTAWTRKRPIEPGYYWYREQHPRGENIFVIRVIKAGDRLLSHGHYIEEYDGEFSGPLEVPK